MTLKFISIFHYKGMNPKKIGNLDAPPPEKKAIPTAIESDVEKFKLEEAEALSGEEQAQTPIRYSERIEEVDETVLINQDFLLDPDITIREFLVQNSLEILDFVRYECGEVIEENN